VREALKEGLYILGTILPSHSASTLWTEDFFSEEVALFVGKDKSAVGTVGYGILSHRHKSYHTFVQLPKRSFSQNILAVIPY
jgi:hypothetical protein